MTKRYVSGGPPREVLAGLRERLREAELAAKDVRSDDPERRTPGVVHVANAGYAILEGLHLLKRKVPNFDGWLGPQIAEIESDPMLRFFSDIRTGATHLAQLTPASHAQSFHFKQNELWTSRPPGANRFTTDQYGRAYWHGTNPDGTMWARPATPPPGMMEVEFVFQSPPTSHLGKPISKLTAAEICDLYVAYLGKLVAEVSALVRA